jgi:hypothetical protein
MATYLTTADLQSKLNLIDPNGNIIDTKQSGFPFNIIFIGWATRTDGLLDEATALQLGVPATSKPGDSGAKITALQKAVIRELKALGVQSPLKTPTGTWTILKKDLTTKAIQTFQLKNAAEFVVTSEITENITSVNMSWSLDGAAQMTISLIDPNMGMLEKNYFLIEGTENELAERRLVVHYNPKIDQWTRYEIASVEYSQGEGSSPNVQLECRSEAVQRMKRDKNPARFSATTGTAWAAAVAKAFDLDFVGEKTYKNRHISAKRNEYGERESVWDVLHKLASDSQFVCFESDGTLFFGTEQWLLGKWGIDLESENVNTNGVVDQETLKALGLLKKIPIANIPKFGQTNNYVKELTHALVNRNIPLTGGETNHFDAEVKKAVVLFQERIAAKRYIPINWPADDPVVNPDGDYRFVVSEMPTVRRSGDSAWQATGSCKLLRNNHSDINQKFIATSTVAYNLDASNAEQFRAGMTVRLNGIFGFSGFYLVDNVSYDEGSPDPVEISFRTPDRLKRRKLADGTYSYTYEKPGILPPKLDITLPANARTKPSVAVVETTP